MRGHCTVMGTSVGTGDPLAKGGGCPCPRTSAWSSLQSTNRPAKGGGGLVRGYELHAGGVQLQSHGMQRAPCRRGMGDNINKEVSYVLEYRRPLAGGLRLRSHHVPRAQKGCGLCCPWRPRPEGSWRESARCSDSSCSAKEACRHRQHAQSAFIRKQK